MSTPSVMVQGELLKVLTDCPVVVANLQCITGVQANDDSVNYIIIRALPPAAAGIVTILILILLCVKIIRRKKSSKG